MEPNATSPAYHPEWLRERKLRRNSIAVLARAAMWPKAVSLVSQKPGWFDDLGGVQLGSGMVRQAAVVPRRHHIRGAGPAWATSHLDLPSLAEGLHLLSDEVGRLRGLLTQQGLAPRGGVA